jgi:PhnB protein
MQLNAYLSFNGQCAEAFKHYERCLHGKIEGMVTYGESPMAQQTPPEMHSRILHARMTVGYALLMGADAPPQFFSQPQGFSVTISVDNTEEAERIFRELAEGGSVRMPL